MVMRPKGGIGEAWDRQTEGDESLREGAHNSRQRTRPCAAPSHLTRGLIKGFFFGRMSDVESLHFLKKGVSVYSQYPCSF